MKTIVTLALVVLITASVGLGYYGIPILIERETAALRADIEKNNERLRKIEEFVTREEEARKTATLEPDAEAERIARTVNDLARRLAALEASVEKTSSQATEAAQALRESIETSSIESAQAIEQARAHLLGQIHSARARAAMAMISAHLLKTRAEMLAQNIGSARSELELIDSICEDTKIILSPERAKEIEDLQKVLAKARYELDTESPPARNRLDFLWFEVYKLSREL